MYAVLLDVKRRDNNGKDGPRGLLSAKNERRAKEERTWTARTTVERKRRDGGSERWWIRRFGVRRWGAGNSGQGLGRFSC
jgi:hypothetical protein